MSRLKKIRTTEPKAGEIYLEDVWKDLSDRNFFQSHNNLSLMICERLFKVLSTKEKKFKFTKEEFDLD